MPTRRQVICADAGAWMKDNRKIGSVVTSLPDADEVGWPPEVWLPWFIEAAALTLEVARDNCPVVFCQTDRKFEGQLISKAFLLLKAAEIKGRRLLWHKIVLRRDPGKVDLFRPTYSHLMAFSKAGKPGKASPDVIDGGKKVYDNGMGLKVTKMAVVFAGQFSPLIVDPFCGRGTVLAMANALGFDALGVDILPEQVEYSKSLKIKELE